MTGYKVNFEYLQFGDIVLNADDEDRAEEMAVTQVAEVHGLDPTDVTVLSVEELNGPTT